MNLHKLVLTDPIPQNIRDSLSGLHADFPSFNFYAVQFEYICNTNQHSVHSNVQHIHYTRPSATGEVCIALETVNRYARNWRRDQAT